MNAVALMLEKPTSCGRKKWTWGSGHTHTWLLVLFGFSFSVILTGVKLNKLFLLQEPKTVLVALQFVIPSHCEKVKILFPNNGRSNGPFQLGRAVGPYIRGPPTTTIDEESLSWAQSMVDCPK
ncbi:hypothetical protein ACH5RR_018172 [Cinchona calisaya]|uniref:Uncharacterized protein n=1 Tax=Cinchona calisaya TaxID=153742 RepID=A0ABD2ZQS0_9GENT